MAHRDQLRIDVPAVPGYPDRHGAGFPTAPYPEDLNEAGDVLQADPVSAPMLRNPF